MAAVCPRCRGTRMVGRGRDRGPCPACNAAAGGIGDQAAGAVQRAMDGLIGRRREVDGRQTTSRPNRFATETTTTRGRSKKKTAAKKKPAATRTPPLMPACDRCGTRGPLTATSRSAVCASGCPPKNGEATP
ncbi:hypothetical protein [Candidatus Frankia nodulisporulans]|uniref:hypothetical protein n=1 Tax=Candidatus Frankia nodulisporulans TaxID=2060052 RepID=UPI0013D2F55A|nr:hypothetical protein [Candidatus Frankia nodulisporulans]